MTLLNQNLMEFDHDETVDEITEFISKTVEEAGAAGVVVGLSGGVDSTLTAILCVKALESDKVIGVLMPAYFTPEQDMEDAAKLAKMLGIQTEIIMIDEICEAFAKSLMVKRDNITNRIPIANILARVRMVILYYIANSRRFLVAGTGDRSEILIGFFTKFGDGGADFFPISHLYKTQVRVLARHLGFPDTMAFKPSNPQLYPGHKLSDEIPIDYEHLDPILASLFDHNLKPDKVSEKVDIPLEIINWIISRHMSSEHKRKMPHKMKAT